MKTKYGFHTTSKRSELMSKIRSKDTKPERILRSYLWKCGIRYRIHNKTIVGNPDIVIKKYKIAIFVDGEFWHGFNWNQKKERIKSNREYWIKKIEGNISRDTRNNRQLKEEGWQVFRFWEKEILTNLTKCAELIISEINKKKC